MHKPVFLAALGIVAIGIALTALPSPFASAANVSVDAGNTYFCNPSFEGATCTTTVNVGDTVTWTVSAGFHTVTQCDANHENCGGDGFFDSGQLEQGQSFSFTFNNPGSYVYYCAFHPSQMEGVVQVVAPTPTPSPAPTAPGSTATPVPSTVAVPAAVPSTGGSPGGAVHDFLPYLVMAGGIMLLGAGGLAYGYARKNE